MNRIQAACTGPAPVLNIYFTAGYPSLHDTVPLAEALVHAGAGMLEIGMPFSDPLADGPVIQHTSTVALRNGMNLRVLFGQLQGIRQRLPDTPLLLMGYLNPVLQFGLEEFCAAAAAVGIDGLILPDLPIDDYLAEYQPTFARHGLRLVFLATPQTSEERLRQLDSLTDSFIYLVSGPGTTGGTATAASAAAQKTYLERVEALNLRNPRLVGFGIADRKSFLAATAHADGAIIGSALLRAIADVPDAPQAAAHFVRTILGTE